jgi:hypothetical protein
MANPKPTTYAEYQAGLHPTALQGPFGAAWGRALGTLKDQHVDLAKQAVKARFVGIAPADALPLVGLERQIERGPGESDASYRARLLAAPDAWAWAGTTKGLLEYALAPAGFTNARVIINADWAAAGGVPPDGNAAFWSRFWVVISAPHPWTRRTWNSGWLYGTPAGQTWDSDATASDVARVERLVKRWAPGHATAMGAFIVFGSSLVPDTVPATAWNEASLTFGGSPCMFWRFT